MGNENNITKPKTTNQLPTNTTYTNTIPKISKYLRKKHIPPIFKRKYQLFAIAGTDMKIHIFSNSLELMGYLHGENLSILCLLSMSSTKLVSGSFESVINVWDLDRKTVHSLISYHTGAITALCAYGDNIIISGSSDKSILIWNLDQPTTPPRILPKSKDSSEIRAIVKLDNKYIVSGEWEGDLRIWDIAQTTCIKHIKGPRSLSQIKYLGDIIACYMRNQLIIWNTSNWKKEKEYKFIKSGWPFEFLGDGKVARGMYSGELKIIDIINTPSDTDCLRTILLHSKGIYDILRIGKNIIITISDDKQLKVVDPLSARSHFVYLIKEGFMRVITRLY